MLNLVFVVYRQNLKEKPVLPTPSIDRREVELATLRELPTGTTFVHQSNALYTAASDGGGGDVIIEVDLAGVPRISKSNLKQATFLGSGAFGEVFEGILTPESGGEESLVAIKVKTGCWFIQTCAT